MIGERVYHKPKQWNVYQPDTFKLDKLLRGIGRFAVELNVKVHIKGFTFTRHSRAWDTLAAGACDAVYGDSFTRDGSRVLGIGNNVSLLFDRAWTLARPAAAASALRAAARCPPTRCI